jgi:hypothetical protein
MNARNQMEFLMEKELSGRIENILMEDGKRF